MNFRNQDLRKDIEAELHSRPYPILHAPAQVSFVASIAGSEDADAASDHLAEICNHFNCPAPPLSVTSFSITCEAGDICWERHQEFYCYTFIRRDAGGEPFEQTAASVMPAHWLDALPGEVFAASHIALEPSSRPEYSRERLHRFFDEARLIGSNVIGDSATAWTSMRVHEDGFGRILIHDRTLNECRTGRLVQRLIDFEIYKALVLRTMPVVREATPEVAETDRGLGLLIESIGSANGIDDERDLLKRLSELAGRVERIRARTATRFQATREYYATLIDRLHELRESDIDGVLTFGQFLDRRLTPAMRQCEQTAALAEDVSIRIGRASDLLRTRIDLTLEVQNQALLASMEHRGRLQLHLQRTIEGVSIAAVAYYLIGLVKAAVDGLNTEGTHMNSALTCLVALPIVLAILWLKGRQVARGIDEMTPQVAE